MRVRSLHRDMLRSVPWVKRAYGVPFSDEKMRSLVTAAFKEKKDATDVTKINRLIVLGRMELEETLMLWKGPSHINNWFDDANAKLKAAEVSKSASPFLDSFFAGSS